jgi:hypothetical protein
LSGLLKSLSKSNLGVFGLFIEDHPLGPYLIFGMEETDHLLRVYLATRTHNGQHMGKQAQMIPVARWTELHIAVLPNDGSRFPGA